MLVIYVFYYFGPLLYTSCILGWLIIMSLNKIFFTYPKKKSYLKLGITLIFHLHFISISLKGMGVSPTFGRNSMEGMEWNVYSLITITFLPIKIRFIPFLFHFPNGFFNVDNLVVEGEVVGATLTSCLCNLPNIKRERGEEGGLFHKSTIEL